VENLVSFYFNSRVEREKFEEEKRRGGPAPILTVGQYTVKKVIDFPVPSRDVTYQLSLAGNNLIIPGQESLVSDILSRDGKRDNLFLWCIFQ
jgi:hypothetical protein